MKSLIFLTLAAIALSPEASAQGSTHSAERRRVIEHAEIVLAQPGNSELRGYLSIWNGEDTSIDLVEVSSQELASITMHRTVADEGILKIRRVEGGLFIPPRSDLVMQPDGVHLALDGEASKLRAGQTLSMVARFADGVELTVQAEVRPAGSSVSDRHHERPNAEGAGKQPGEAP